MVENNHIYICIYLSIYLSIWITLLYNLKLTQYCKSAMREYVLSPFRCVQLFVNLWTVACQAALSMGFSRQEYWSGLSCPPPGDLPNPGTELISLMSSALADMFFITNASWEAHKSTGLQQKLNSRAAACKVPPSPSCFTSLILSFLICSMRGMAQKALGRSNKLNSVNT